MKSQNLSWTFDTVAETYEKMRPGYADALYQTIFDYLPINKKSRAVEVGIGGGQATLPILQTGCEVTAVEQGEQLSRVCREKFRDFPNFSVITGKFEETPFRSNTFDLVYSASAFHWIPEELGYPQVFAMLKPGGAFARFANHPFRAKDNPALAETMDRAYADYYYPYYQKEPQVLTEYSKTQARERAEIAAKYGFTDIRYALFTRTRTFSPQEYSRLLGTYSDHIALPDPIRAEFFAKIEEAIRAHGGSITVFDTMDLELARKQA